MTGGLLLICLPVVAAVVAAGHAVKPRPRLHPAPKPARPVAAAPHVPEPIVRPRPRVVRPRVRPTPAIECKLVRVPPWLADAGGYAPGWWPGYAPAAGAGGYFAPAPVAGVSYGGGWGGGWPVAWPGGWPGGWIVPPGPGAVAAPPPPAHAAATAYASAVAVAVVIVHAPPGTPAVPGPGTPPGDALAPGPVPDRVTVTTGYLPPGAVPPGPRDVPEPGSLAVVLAGLAAVAATARRVRANIGRTR